jgi:YtcA family
MNTSTVTSCLRHLWLTLLGTLLLAGCSRAPVIDILGSFFPAWLVCSMVAIVLTAIVRVVLLRLQLQLALPVLVYPALAALFTFALWLIFFH